MSELGTRLNLFDFLFGKYL